MTLRSSSSPNSAIVITDASVKNDIATSISHIHIHNHPLIKMVHQAAYVTSTDAELFAIKCSINQACSKNDISKIIVVTDSIHTALKAVPIHINSIQLLFFKNCINSSPKIKTTPSNFGNVLVVSTGDFIKQLIRIPNHSILNLCFQVIFHGIIARRSIATTSSVIGK